MSNTGLPPEMSRADLKDYLMNPPEALTAEERQDFEPICDAIVDEIFTQRANPRVILTPIAINLARIAILKVDEMVIGHIYAGGKS